MSYHTKEQRANQTPWQVAHSLQCDVEYYLSETDSKHIELPKHALDMMLKYIAIELQRIKDLTKSN